MSKLNDELLNEIFMGPDPNKDISIESDSNIKSTNNLPATVSTNTCKLSSQELSFDDSDEEKERINSERKEIRQKENESALSAAVD